MGSAVVLKILLKCEKTAPKSNILQFDIILKGMRLNDTHTKELNSCQLYDIKLNMNCLAFEVTRPNRILEEISG